MDEELVRQLLLSAGEDPDREGLRQTPTRFLRAFAHYTSGYNQDPAKVLKTFEDGANNYNEMVSQQDLELWSLCEHHLAPFFGTAAVSYIPDKRIVGLSKIARVINIFSRRLQVQERLTVEIADCLMNHLAPKGVGVTLRCRHTCMESRGVEKKSVTVTTALRGVYLTDPRVRGEFLSFVNAR